jgi:TM2 domain-containing membrane protein YozV
MSDQGSAPDPSEPSDLGAAPPPPPAPDPAISVPPPPPAPPPPYGASAAAYAGTAPPESKKVLAGILGILLGSLGIHKFVLGYTKEGVIMLLITVLTCGLGSIVTGVIGLVEGIIYLTKSDEEFVQTYQVGRKGWF